MFNRAATSREYRTELACLLEVEYELSTESSTAIAESAILRSLRAADPLETPFDGGLVIVSGELRGASGTVWYRGAVVDAHDVGQEEVVAAGPTVLAHLLPDELTSLLRSVISPAAVVRGVGRKPTAVVLAIVAGPSIDSRWFTTQVTSLLDCSVSTIRPGHVDHLVGVVGAVDAESGAPGDLAVRRLLHERAEHHDVVLLETANRPDAWTRRAMRSADRIIVACSSSCIDSGELDRLRVTIDHAPLDTPRDVVVLSRSDRPRMTSDLLDRLSCGAAIHVRVGSASDLARASRTLGRRATSLVLGGGGARGFAHLGVYRALLELGIEVDQVVGSSVGAPLGAAMADGYEPAELDELVARLFSRAMDYTLPVVSLVKGREIARATASVFNARHIEDLGRSFRCVSTDLTTGFTHVHARGSIVHAVRASCAVPGVMPPVPHAGHLLVDGGLTNNLPVDVALGDQPAGQVIAVDVLPSRGLVSREDYGLSVSGSRALIDRVRSKRRHPPLASTLMRSLVLSAHRQVADVARQPNVRVLDLDLSGTAMFDFGAVAATARRGYEQAMPLLERWLAERALGENALLDDKPECGARKSWDREQPCSRPIDPERIHYVATDHS